MARKTTKAGSGKQSNRNARNVPPAIKRSARLKARAEAKIQSTQPQNENINSIQQTKPPPTEPQKATHETVGTVVESNDPPQASLRPKQQLPAVEHLPLHRRKAVHETVGAVAPLKAPQDPTPLDPVSALGLVMSVSVGTTASEENSSRSAVGNSVAYTKTQANVIDAFIRVGRSHPEEAMSSQF